MIFDDWWESEETQKRIKNHNSVYGGFCVGHAAKNLAHHAWIAGRDDVLENLDRYACVSRLSAYNEDTVCDDDFTVRGTDTPADVLRKIKKVLQAVKGEYNKLKELSEED